MTISRPLVCILLGAVLLTGCNRAFYRRQADRDATCAIQQKSNNPRWDMSRFSVEVDPRSRYFDPYDPDRPPMPEDDPYSHLYMHCVNGMKGWKGWHRNGTRSNLENPVWQDHLQGYVPFNERGEVVLSLDSALRLAYVHSPDNQEQIETIFLSALDVTTERFRLETQFFGGNTTEFTHNGRLVPGRTVRPPGLPPFNADLNRLATDTDFRLERRFATAGELLVGFANSFVWQFAGPDTNSTLSLLNFSLVQPLLRNAGRSIALEQLTIVERALLANLRAYQRYRRGFFTDVAIGESVGGASRRGGFFGGTGLTGFTGTGAGGLGGVGQITGFGRGGFGAGGGGAAGAAGFAGGGAGTVGGFIGLLQSLQQNRNARASLNLQLRQLALLESSLDAGVIDLTQVDQFRQSIETSRAVLLQNEISLENGLESFKTGTLGLPPDLPIALDDTLIQPFQLIDSATTELQDRIVALQNSTGQLADEPALDNVAAALQSAVELDPEFQEIFKASQLDLEVAREGSPERRRGMAEVDQAEFDKDLANLATALQQLAQRYEGLIPRRELLQNQLNQSNTREVTDALVIWLRDLLTVVQEVQLVQARARLESVVVEPINLDSQRAFDIAVANRLDIMNNRASLVDSWRLIQFNAKALQSNLEVVFSGNMETVGNNPVKFRAPTGTLRAGLRFDAPFTRLLERNNYRQQLIEYQQSRRQLIQFYDGVKQSLRAQLRNLEQLRVNLEIQRRASVIAIRRVDLSREELNAPQAPPQPGQPASQLGPTAATNLLSALNDLQGTQDNFMSVYLNYYASRMRLERDLGIMAIDSEGRWVEAAAPETEMPMGEETLEELPMVPPAIPEPLIREFIEVPPTAGTGGNHNGLPVIYDASTRNRATTTRSN